MATTKKAINLSVSIKTTSKKIWYKNMKIKSQLNLSYFPKSTVLGRWNIGGKNNLEDFHSRAEYAHESQAKHGKPTQWNFREGMAV